MNAFLKGVVCVSMSLLAVMSYASQKMEMPYVAKLTFSVVNSKEAAKYCVENLGMENIEIPDPTLAKGRSWVRFPESGLEVHFVDARNRYGESEIREYYEYMDALDEDMTVFTTFMDNHAAVLVDDLSPYLEHLTQKDIPFLGPVRRADGVYQLYLQIPGVAYIELDSKTVPDKKFATTTWDKVNFAPVN